MSGAKAFRFDRLDAASTVTAQLRQLARLANDGLDRLSALEVDRLRSVQAISAYRRPGALMPLLALLHHHPLLSPEQAAQMLGLTVSGAGKLLTKAAAAGLVREVTGRGSWRVYIVPDLAIHFGYAAAPIGRPRKAPALAPDLDAVLAAFDREMAALAPMLANHDSGSNGPQQDFPA